ncbi:MAG TPA: sulfur carrier protein ThiS [Candidatus Dormibacteraeota bacterium]|nr:sulfur carrier protein ThiS [Candidatus Dormibacteraeota bacterium]
MSERGAIEVVANGEPRSVPAGSTVVTLLERLAVDPATVVVERNGEILRGSALGQAALEPGDVLEIVHFVGGG